MKKFLILFACIVFLVGTIQAQVPNFSFEEANFDGSLKNWGNVYIEEVWLDSTGEMHGDSIYLDFAYYFQTNEPWNGAWAAEMRNSFNYTENTGRAGAIVADLDSVFTAWGSFETIPLIATPSQLGFFYKHVGENGDTASAEITVFDSLGNEIGFGRTIIPNSTLAYTHAVTPIVYTTSDIPATAMIKFSNFYTVAPDVRQPSLGSRFVVDDVQLYNITGFDFLSRQQLDVMVYPNPSSESFVIKRNTAVTAQVKLFSMTGELVKQQVISGESAVLGLSDLVSGSYVLEVESSGKSWKQVMLVEH